MSFIEFNRTLIGTGRSIEDPSDEVIKNTPALWNCDLDTAVKYGGDLTRAALGAMDLSKIIRTQQQVYVPEAFGW